MIDFSELKILVIGDVMLDKYVWGKVDRISPEAPVPVLDAKSITHALGGASNVANNISSLGGLACLVSVTGNDSAREEFASLLKAANISHKLFVDSNRVTTIKERLMGGNYQLLRVDYENKTELDKNMCREIIRYLDQIIHDYDVVVVSDYNKGMLCEAITAPLVDLCTANGKRLIADPKPQNAPLFAGCYLMAPNVHEASQISGMRLDCLDARIEAAKAISDKYLCNVLITCGADGMLLYEKEGSHHSLEANTKEVFDVTGAGDTVMAVLSLGLAYNMGLPDACKLANYAASVVVRKVGTATVSPKELEKYSR